MAASYVYIANSPIHLADKTIQEQNKIESTSAKEIQMKNKTWHGKCEPSEQPNRDNTLPKVITHQENGEQRKLLRKSEARSQRKALQDTNIG